MSQIDMKKAAGLLMAGAMVGAGIALLFAPKSGARTRKDIQRFARRTVDRVDDLQGDIRDQVTDWVGDLTEVVKDGVDRSKKLGTAGFEKALLAFDSAKTCVEEGKSRAEQLIKRENA
jgi:gas vesicle protein